MKCVDCEEKRTCPESKFGKDDRAYCSFAEDTGNEDSGSALIQYESGMHVSYSQNFFARKKAAARGARFLGYKGTIDFDFYTGQVKVFMHHSTRVETFEFSGEEGHFGGDSVLAKNFIELMQGGTESVSTLDDGLQSALLCLKAKQSALMGMFQQVSWE